MLEKIILVANNARIIYNHLQPNRASVGIKPAAEMIVRELVGPWLQAKKERDRKTLESKESSNLAKKARTSWTASKTLWSAEMVDSLAHLPRQIVADENVPSRVLLICRPNTTKLSFYSPVYVGSTQGGR